MTEQFFDKELAVCKTAIPGLMEFDILCGDTTVWLVLKKNFQKEKMLPLASLKASREGKLQKQYFILLAKMFWCGLHAESLGTSTFVADEGKVLELG